MRSSWSGFGRGEADRGRLPQSRRRVELAGLERRLEVAGSSKKRSPSARASARESASGRRDRPERIRRDGGGDRLGAGIAELDRRGRLEHRVVVVELRQDERPRADRRPAERIVGEFADRDRLEEVGRRDRLRGQLEPAERRGEVDPDRAVDGRRRDLAPRPGAGPVYSGLRGDVDR